MIRKLLVSTNYIGTFASGFTRSIPHECHELGGKGVLENSITQHFGDVVILSIHLSIFQSLVILPLNRGYRNENVFAKTLSSSLPSLKD